MINIHYCTYTYIDIFKALSAFLFYLQIIAKRFCCTISQDIFTITYLADICLCKINIDIYNDFFLFHMTYFTLLTF